MTKNKSLTSLQGIILIFIIALSLLVSSQAYNITNSPITGNIVNKNAEDFSFEEEIKKKTISLI